MRTIDEIIMHADPDYIFAAAANVHKWPDILPHYRWVTEIISSNVQNTLDNGEIVVEMAATRSFIPVKWTSIQRLDAARRRVYYRHIGGATRGMEVVWSIEPEDDGVRVKIIHDVTLDIPVIRCFIGKWIVGNFFVKHIASKTLEGIKKFVEVRKDSISTKQQCQ